MSFDPVKFNKKINDKIEYSTDSRLWDEKDYWATPKETLKKGKGDCEDIAIVKFFAMLDKGLDPTLIKMLYCYYKKQAHMVVLYDNLVLDNMHEQVMSLVDRTDIDPVYCFNTCGVWVNNEYIGMPERIDLWRDLLTRIDAYSWLK